MILEHGCEQMLLFTRMGFVWYSHVFRMVFVCVSYGFAWFSYGFQLFFVRFSHAFLHGFRTAFVRFSYGFRLGDLVKLICSASIRRSRNSVNSKFCVEIGWQPGHTLIHGNHKKTNGKSTNLEKTAIRDCFFEAPLSHTFQIRMVSSRRELRRQYSTHATIWYLLYAICDTIYAVCYML